MQVNPRTLVPRFLPIWGDLILDVGYKEETGHKYMKASATDRQLSFILCCVSLWSTASLANAGEEKASNTMVLPVRYLASICLFSTFFCIKGIVMHPFETFGD